MYEVTKQASRDRRVEAAKLREKGMLVREIAVHYGVTIGAIWRWLQWYRANVGEITKGHTAADEMYHIIQENPGISKVEFSKKVGRPGQGDALLTRLEVAGRLVAEDDRGHLWAFDEVTMDIPQTTTKLLRSEHASR